MIFLYRAKLAILSQPKTGTTALEAALAPKASIAVNDPPGLKHIGYNGFMRTFAPLIQRRTGTKRSEYDVVSIMREPIDWLGSWYRYRARELLGSSDNQRRYYTGDVTFDEFVVEVCKDEGERAAFAKVGKPHSVSQSKDDGIAVDRLFPYSDLSRLYSLIEEKTGEPLRIGRHNVSPSLPLELSGKTRALIEQKFAFAFDLYSSLTPDGNVPSRFRSSAMLAND